MKMMSVWKTVGRKKSLSEGTDVTIMFKKNHKLERTTTKRY